MLSLLTPDQLVNASANMVNYAVKPGGPNFESLVSIFAYTLDINNANT